jgi:hypothetical protein
MALRTQILRLFYFTPLRNVAAALVSGLLISCFVNAEVSDPY